MVCLLLASAVVPIRAERAVAITGTVDSSAYGIQASVTLLSALTLNIPVQPAAAYPAGPTSGSTVGVNVLGLASTGVLNTDADGDPLADTATASSSVAGLSLLPATAVAIGATGVVGSSCSATATAVSGSSTLVGLSIPGAGTIPVNPAANTEINISVLGITIAKVFLNEQSTSNTGGLRKISVNALRLQLLGGVLGSLGTGSITVGHSECTTTIPSTPTITSFSPTQGPQAGGTTLTIDGTNFLAASQVLIDGVSVPFTRVSLTRVTATTSAHSPGATSVKVVNPAGTATAAQQFTFLPLPTVTALSPSSGPTAGGTTVTITGTGFTGATAVTFDGVAAGGFTVVNSTTITATAPAGTGTDFVQVTAPGGTSATSAGGAYTYVAAPTLGSISPTSGPTTGGTTLDLTGTGFTAASQVRVDGVLQTATYVSPTSLQITTPAHAAGAVPVTVTTVGGTTTTRTFTYLAVPTVSNLSPGSGSTVGGETVVVTGTGLGSVTGVTVDGSSATITVQSAGSLSFTTPAHAAGVAGVVLTGPGAITTNAGSYIYVLPVPPAPTDPTVTSLSPATGPQSGGTVVTVTGTNLTGATAVSFDGVPATAVTVNSSTSVTATAPAGAASGPVSVTVTTAVGTSAVSAGGTYTYQAPAPGLTSLSPTHGPITGGTEVTLTGTNFTVGSTVTLDQSTTLPSTYLDANHLTVTMPPHAAGGVDIEVHTGSLQSSNLTYTYDPTPGVSGLNPSSGTTVGGTTVTVTGTNLNTVTHVNIDGVNRTPSAQTSTSLTFTTPAHVAGAADVLLRDGSTAGNSTFSVNAGSYLYVTPAPVITSISPTHGPLAGGTSVTITGTSLDNPSSVSIGGELATITGTPTSTSVTVTTPAGNGVGPAALSLVTSGGTAVATYTYDPLPEVTSISPTQGPDDGGTTVVITGTGFTGATDVFFGAAPATAFTVNSNTQITVDSPAHAPGVVDVRVETASGTSAAAAGDRFTYLDTHAIPTVSGVSPAVGPTGGATAVTLTGTGFNGTTSVTFDGVGAAFAVVNDTTITATTPAHAAGAVDVVVTDPNGSSVPSSNSEFSYVAPGSAPTLTGVTPASGPLAGGTAVTITGLGFTGVTDVDFDGTPATSVVVVNDTTITAVSPGRPAGPAHVTVTSPAGTSAPAAGDVFTYRDVPTISLLNPASGPEAGGSTVTLTGTGFSDATGVSFGGVPGTGISVSSDTSLTVTSPAGTGAVQVTVTGPGGTSAGQTFTYQAPPAITGLNFNSGPVAGGTAVTITGSGFTAATSVDFGGAAGSSLTVVNDTTITVTSPPHAAGQVDVRVTGPFGTSDVVAADQFTFVPPIPAISNVSPASGSAGGGTTVTLTGTGFTNATAVDFGGTPGTNVSISSDTTLTVTSPAHAAGAVQITVTGPGGTSPGATFTFNAAPAITNLNPASGPSAGGTSVTITGTDLTGSTAVRFGGLSASFTVNSSTEIVAISPAQSAGPVDVVILGPNGASSVVPAAEFTYTPPAAPAITSLSPTSGMTSGGTTITVTGTGFTDATGVDFGATPGTSVSVSSDTSLTVLSPAHVAGAVQVTVTGPGGTSPGATFTYNAAPAISGVSPPSGASAGGETVTISGSGFTGATAVKFGATNGTGVTVVNDSTITVTTPAHAGGQVDVRVSGPQGTSPIVAADEFTFIPPAPAISNLNPTSGPLAGGTVVTITGTDFTNATAVDFGGSPGTSLAVANDTTLTVTTPAHAAGAVQVTITGPGGTSTGATFTFNPVPAITGVSPASGSPAGGTLVTITGSGFTGATSVDFGGTPGTGLTVVNDSTITVISPAHAGGQVHLQVNGPNGNSAQTSADQFSFSQPVPTVSSLSPTFGSLAGGTTVTLTGTGFTNATAVYFGGTPGLNVAVSSGTSLTVTTPAHAVGPVQVTVTGPGGTSVGGPTFTYTVTPPVLNSIDPDAVSITGGTLITATGSGFTGTTSVTVDGSSVAFTIVDDSTITFLSPAHDAGEAVIVITGPGGASVSNPKLTYTLGNPSLLPVITGISPDRGPLAGGTKVTLTGSGFTGATEVLFDGIPGTDLVVVDDNTITVRTPAGVTAPNDVDVVVVGPNGNSPAEDGPVFGYVPLSGLPTISAMTPWVGPDDGGTRVTFYGTNFDEYTTVTFDGLPAHNLVLGPDVDAAKARSRSRSGLHAAASTSLSVDSPPHAWGWVKVAVTNAAGTHHFAPGFTFIPDNEHTKLKLTVVAGSTTRIEPRAADIVGMKVTSCSRPTDGGSSRLTARGSACRYTAPRIPGSDTFEMRVRDVAGQTAIQTVNVTVVGADKDPGRDPESDENPPGVLAFTGASSLLRIGIGGGLALLLTGIGLVVAADRLGGGRYIVRRRHHP